MEISNVYFIQRRISEVFKHFFPFHLSTWPYVILNSGILTRREFSVGWGEKCFVIPDSRKFFNEIWQMRTKFTKKTFEI